MANQDDSKTQLKSPHTASKSVAGLLAPATSVADLAPGEVHEELMLETLREVCDAGEAAADEILAESPVVRSESLFSSAFAAAPESLEGLLAHCDSSSPLSPEDRQWIDAEPIGREVL